MDMKDLRKLRKEQTEEALLDRIDDMQPQQAKDYLKRLVQDKLDVGVQMMDSEGML